MLSSGLSHIRTDAPLAFGTYAKSMGFWGSHLINARAIPPFKAGWHGRVSAQIASARRASTTFRARLLRSA